MNSMVAKSANPIWLNRSGKSIALNIKFLHNCHLSEKAYLTAFRTLILVCTLMWLRTKNLITTHLEHKTSSPLQRQAVS